MEVIFKVGTDEQSLSSHFVEVSFRKKNFGAIIEKKIMSLAECLQKMRGKELFCRFVLNFDENVKEREFILIISLSRRIGEKSHEQVDSKLFTLMSKYI